MTIQYKTQQALLDLRQIILILCSVTWSDFRLMKQLIHTVLTMYHNTFTSHLPLTVYVCITGYI